MQNQTHSNNDELKDPASDPANPYKVTIEEIREATVLITDGIQITPCVHSNLSSCLQMDIFLKNENLQYTGSFKERGARNALLHLSATEKRNGVVTASLGNHSQGLSYHSKLLGIPCTVVMPVTAPLMKIKKCQSYGANVIVRGNDMSEARTIALSEAKEKSLTFINAYDHPKVIAGQGTIGLEICEQVKNVDAVIVPVGGGGLIGGISTAVKAINPKIMVIGVESDRVASFTAAMNAGGPVPTTALTSLADGLAVPFVGYNSFASAVPNIDKMVVVSEDWIALAILKLVESEKAIVEGGGAVGLAAILAGKLDELRNKRVVIIISGGNIDTSVFGRCLDRGLVAEGRLVSFEVMISDRPGGLASLCSALGDMGVSIRDVDFSERTWVNDVHSAKIRIICETRDSDHADELKKMLAKHNAVITDLPLTKE